MPSLSGGASGWELLPRKLCHRAVENQHRFLHVLQITVFPGLLGQLRRTITMIAALLLLGLTALVGKAGCGFGLLSKALREPFAEGLQREGAPSGLRSPFSMAL